MKHQCPVCGYNGLARAAYEGSPANYMSPASQQICSCCDFQFGYDDDDQDISFAQWRADWIADGMPWRNNGKKPPKNWDAREQFRQVDLTVERGKWPEDHIVNKWW
jgi:hypothetical protein